jgi:hypothetical protein
MSVSEATTKFIPGDLVGFRGHKVDAIIFTVNRITEVNGERYLCDFSGLYFLATECRVITPAR